MIGAARTGSGFAWVDISVFLHIVALQRYREDHDIGQAKHDHAPIHEAVEGLRFVVERKPAAPIAKTAATQIAHHGRAEHAAVAHAGYKAGDDDRPECTRLYRFLLHLLSLYIRLNLSTMPPPQELYSKASSDATERAQSIRRCAGGAVQRTQLQNAGTARGGGGVALRTLQAPQRPPSIHRPRIDYQYLLQQLLTAEAARRCRIEVRQQPVGHCIVNPAVMRVGLVSESEQMIGLERGALPACQLASHAKFGADVRPFEFLLLRRWNAQQRGCLFDRGPPRQQGLQQRRHVGAAAIVQARQQKFDDRRPFMLGRPCTRRYRPPIASQPFVYAFRRRDL